MKRSFLPILIITCILFSQAQAFFPWLGIAAVGLVGAGIGAGAATYAIHRQQDASSIGPSGCPFSRPYALGARCLPYCPSRYTATADYQCV